MSMCSQKIINKSRKLSIHKPLKIAVKKKKILIDKLLPINFHSSKDKQETKILIIEDNEINIRLAVLFLKGCGYTNILIAPNGRQAIEMFTNDIDFVLLDIGLPDINGLEVCKKIRNLEVQKRIPIIAYTSNSDLTDEEFRAAGFDDYAIKPVTFGEFKKLVERWLL